ncbi:unnamed protein product [Notodromas monacha]|uniref:Uncharacterized protein n=1 Tax=Notodromas monacha TaxID=399045 RepID=A0A7R9GIZ1_9CRUS|nr:unnamed protein product [Notodromas monacha]CAG0922971.1 unnamed protein product [Notodromas monacha]
MSPVCLAWIVAARNGFAATAGKPLLAMMDEENSEGMMSMTTPPTMASSSSSNSRDGLPWAAPVAMPAMGGVSRRDFLKVRRLRRQQVEPQEYTVCSRYPTTPSRPTTTRPPSAAAPNPPSAAAPNPHAIFRMNPTVDDDPNLVMANFRHLTPAGRENMDTTTPIAPVSSDNMHGEHHASDALMRSFEKFMRPQIEGTRFQDKGIDTDNKNSVNEMSNDEKEAYDGHRQWRFSVLRSDHAPAAADGEQAAASTSSSSASSSKVVSSTRNNSKNNKFIMYKLLKKVSFCTLARNSAKKMTNDQQHQQQQKAGTHTDADKDTLALDNETATTTSTAETKTNNRQEVHHHHHHHQPQGGSSSNRALEDAIISALMPPDVQRDLAAADAAMGEHHALPSAKVRNEKEDSKSQVLAKN